MTTTDDTGMVRLLRSARELEDSDDFDDGPLGFAQASSTLPGRRRTSVMTAEDFQPSAYRFFRKGIQKRTRSSIVPTPGAPAAVSTPNKRKPGTATSKTAVPNGRLSVAQAPYSRNSVAQPPNGRASVTQRTRTSPPHAPATPFLHNKFKEDTEPQSSLTYQRHARGGPTVEEQEEREAEEMAMEKLLDRRREERRKRKMADGNQKWREEDFDRGHTDQTQEAGGIASGDWESLANLVDRLKVGEETTELKAAHQDFMKEFWSMYYRYPADRVPKPGDGIHEPAPSHLDARPTEMALAARKRRTSSLARPRHVTRKKEAIDLQNKAEEMKNQVLEGIISQRQRRFFGGTGLHHPLRKGPQTPLEPTTPNFASTPAAQQHFQLDPNPAIPSAGASPSTTTARPRTNPTVPPPTAAPQHPNQTWQSAVRTPEAAALGIRLDADIDPHSAGTRAYRNLHIRAPPGIAVERHHPNDGKPGHRARRRPYSAPPLSRDGVDAGRPTTRHHDDALHDGTFSPRPTSARESRPPPPLARVRARPPSAFPALRLPSIVRLEGPMPSLEDLPDGVEAMAALTNGWARKAGHEDLIGPAAPRGYKRGYKEGLEMLRKPAFQRTVEEVRALTTWLRPLQAFRKLKSEFIFNQLVERSVVQELPRGTVVFRQGDLGEAWHIVLSGRLDVLVSKGFDLERKTMISTLKSGDAFGSQALIHDGPRTATVVCETPVVMLRVEKSVYVKLLGFLHVVERKEMIHFLRHRVALFQHFETGALRNVSERMSVRSFAANTVIIREGEQRDHIYILKKGCCAVFRKVVLEGLDANGQPRVSQVLLGNLTAGATFNEGVALHPASYVGCSFTVVALGPAPVEMAKEFGEDDENPEEVVQCFSLGAVGEWTNMRLNVVPSKFGSMSNLELIRLRAMEIRKSKFRTYQRHVLKTLARERTHDPNATISDVQRITLNSTIPKWEV
ncbi:hypothetical protein HK101_003279 [Irineochytrium annulatum]|nr:hypothetical protein HK101_003279 [Irineochytrium annulatum]